MMFLRERYLPLLLSKANVYWNYDSALKGLWIIAFADPTHKIMCHLSSCHLEEVNYSVFPLEPENCWFLHPRNYLLLIPLVCLHLFGLLGKHLSVLYVIKMFNLYYHRKLANPHVSHSFCIPFSFEPLQEFQTVCGLDASPYLKEQWYQNRHIKGDKNSLSSKLFSSQPFRTATPRIKLFGGVMHQFAYPFLDCLWNPFEVELPQEDSKLG